MWPSVGLSDKFLVSLVGTLFGQKTMTTFTYQVAGGTGDSPNINDVSSALAELIQEPDGLVEEYLLLVPNELTLNSIWVQCIERGTGGARMAKLDYAVDEVGTGGSAVDAVAQLAITRRSIIAGPGEHGTIRIPAAANATNAAAGMWLSGFLMKAADFEGHLSSDLVVGTGGSTTDLEPIINHGFGALNVSNIFSTEVHPEVRSQRTRVVGRGI